MPYTDRTIRDLVQGFGQHIRELNSAQYKESRLRQDYLDDFWRNIVMHGGVLAKEDIERVGMNIRDWIRQTG